MALSDDEIASLEATHKRVAVVRSKHNDWEVVYRKPSREEYRRFRKLVDAWLAAHSKGFTEVEGGGIDVDLGREQPMMIGLMNLAQKCHIAAPEDWPAIVSEHLGSVLDGATEPDMTWEAVKDILKVRIYPDDYGAGLPASAGPLLISKAVAPGAVAALAVDYPKTVASVPPGAVDDWGKPIDGLFEIGMANVRANDRPSVQRQEVDGGGKITILIGDSFFTATWALMLDQFVTGESPNGEIVAIPNRHIVGFMQIKDLSIVEGITGIIAFANHFYQQGPGPITRNIYWRHEGKLTLLPTVVEGTTVRFSPPAEFVEMLNRLHKPGA